MYHQQAMRAFSWHGWLVWPAAVGVWIFWKATENRIRLDMKRSREGLPPLHGIPHHGVLMVVAVTYLFELGVWIAQIAVTIGMDQETNAIVFGMAHILLYAMLSGCVFLLSRVERSYPMALDVPAA